VQERCVGGTSAFATAVGVDPGVDVAGKPDAALCQRGHWRGEVGTAGDLVDALSADATELDADLMRADEGRYSAHRLKVGSSQLVWQLLDARTQRFRFACCFTLA
jgi:hypothetical protein